MAPVFFTACTAAAAIVALGTAATAAAPDPTADTQHVYSPCPEADGYTVYPQHCVGQSGDCATALAINRQCTLGVAGCIAQAASNCTATPACHGFAVLTGKTGCSGGKARAIPWQTFAEGSASVDANAAWTAYAKPGGKPPPPPAPPHPHPAPPAAFRFASSQGDNMVLQMAPAQATVWGFVGQGAAVTVTFNGQSIKAKASSWLNQSTWLAKLPATTGVINTPQGAQEFNITATSGGATITLANVVFGDVWVCSGQSNMAYPLGSPTCWNASNINCTAPPVNGYVDAQCSYGCVQNAGQEIKDMANYPNMRLYQNLDGARGPEHSGGSKTPLAESSNSGWLTSDKFNGGWDCSPHNGECGDFSAMCWFFGRDLYTSLAASGKTRPIGLIETNVGGTPDQRWSSPDALDACKNLPGNPPWQWPSNFTDSDLWNGKVVPLLRNTIKGAVWMQGESNSNIDGRQYNCSFAAMISDWRSKWSDGTDGATNASFPFGWAQLNSYRAATKWVAGGSTPARKSDPTDPLGVWAAGFPSIRLAESNTLSLPNTFQAVILDTPVASGAVHSPYKATAGDRLARAALATAYGVAQPSPVVTSVKVSGTTAVITIGGVAGGATVMRRATLGFEALGTDNNWHMVAITPSSGGGASADQVVVGGLPPGAKALRYLWTDAPCGQTYGNLEPYRCPIYVQAPLLQNPPLSGQFDFLPLGPFYAEL